MTMDMFHKLQGLVDKVAELIPEGDYVEICNVIKEIHDRVKPPSFLLDQNEPMVRDWPLLARDALPVTDGQWPLMVGDD